MLTGIAADVIPPQDVLWKMPITSSQIMNICAKKKILDLYSWRDTDLYILKGKSLFVNWNSAFISTDPLLDWFNDLSCIIQLVSISAVSTIWVISRFQYFYKAFVDMLQISYHVRVINLSTINPNDMLFLYCWYRFPSLG